jgi:hypothetical protein
MSKIVVQAFVTLDGVVQAGGGPDEDRDGSFCSTIWERMSASLVVLSTRTMSDPPHAPCVPWAMGDLTGLG